MGEGESNGEVGRDSGLAYAAFAGGNADDVFDVRYATWLWWTGASTWHGGWYALVVAGKAEGVFV